MDALRFEGQMSMIRMIRDAIPTYKEISIVNDVGLQASLARILDVITAVIEHNEMLSIHFNTNSRFAKVDTLCYIVEMRTFEEKEFDAICARFFLIIKILLDEIEKLKQIIGSQRHCDIFRMFNGVVEILANSEKKVWHSREIFYRLVNYYAILVKVLLDPKLKDWKKYTTKTKQVCHSARF